MVDELKSMLRNEIWELVDLQEGFKPIACKLELKNKKYFSRIPL